MPEDLTVYGIEPHGTERCPILHTRITDMAAHHVRQIRRIQPRGPYILGGLCAGGTIAFEMALQLEARGHCVGLVALLDAADPKVPRAVGRSRQRWARFLGAMRDVRGFLPVRVGRMVVVASRKLGNLAMYEMSTRARISPTGCGSGSSARWATGGDRCLGTREAFRFAACSCSR